MGASVIRLRLGDGLLRQQSTQGLRDQITQRRATLHGRDFGSLHEIVRQIEGGAHKYAYMLSCTKSQPF